jgi:Uncharacterized protein family UPF0029
MQDIDGTIHEDIQAELEMLQAAYPDEITLDNSTRFTLHLSPTACLTLECQALDDAIDLQLVSSRSNADKARMERAVSALKEALTDGGLVACSAALEAWNESAPVHISPTLQEAAVVETVQPLASSRFEWITGSPLVDRKSTFVAHVCRVYSEQDVREAVHELVSSNSKLQRATHNMVS